MSKSISLFLLLASWALAVEYDCDVGCSLDPLVSGLAVCGEDGITYTNECLAFCQNVSIANVGPCSGHVDELFRDVVDSAVISLETMKRYETSGFRFVGVRVQSVKAKKSVLDSYENRTDGDSPSYGVTARIVRAVQVTRDGFEYKAAFDLSTISDDGEDEELEPSEGTEWDDEDAGSRRMLRSLVVVGSDTRTKSSSPKLFPLSAIGTLDIFGPNSAGCTATLISRNTALTAGHCLFEEADKPYYLYGFAPGRSTNSHGQLTNYFDSWGVDSVMTFEPFLEDGDKRFDIGFIKLLPRTRKLDGCQHLYPGDVVGYVGLGRIRLDERLPRLERATLTGYPSDMTPGQQTTTGQCSPSPKLEEDGVLRHFCDTFGGMSGAAVLTRGSKALGVHAYGYYGPTSEENYNGAVMFGDSTYEAFKSLANLRDSGLPRCAVKCPCSGMRFRFMRYPCMLVFFSVCLYQRI